MFKLLHFSKHVKGFLLILALSWDWKFTVDLGNSRWPNSLTIKVHLVEASTGASSSTTQAQFWFKTTIISLLLCRNKNQYKPKSYPHLNRPKISTNYKSSILCVDVTNHRKSKFIKDNILKRLGLCSEVNVEMWVFQNFWSFLRHPMFGIRNFLQKHTQDIFLV